QIRERYGSYSAGVGTDMSSSQREASPYHYWNEHKADDVQGYQCTAGSEVLHHLEAVLPVRVEFGKDGGGLEPVALVEPDRFLVRDADLEFDSPQAAHRAPLDERVHDLAPEPATPPSGGDREHQDPRLAVRTDHRGEESDRMPIEVRDEEAVPPPAVDVQIQGGRAVLPQRLPDDRCDRGDVVRNERADAHGAAEGSVRFQNAGRRQTHPWRHRWADVRAFIELSGEHPTL